MILIVRGHWAWSYQLFYLYCLVILKSANIHKNVEEIKEYSSGKDFFITSLEKLNLWAHKHLKQNLLIWVYTEVHVKKGSAWLRILKILLSYIGFYKNSMRVVYMVKMLDFCEFNFSDKEKYSATIWIKHSHWWWWFKY